MCTMFCVLCSEEVFKLIKEIHKQHANPGTQRTYNSALRVYDVRGWHFNAQ